MTGEVDRLKQVQAQINDISPSFCTAKWLQVTLHLQNGKNHSCHHPSTHDIPLKEIEINPSALHNTSYKKQQRAKMLNGERPKECQYCWNVEDLPGDHLSDRYVKSGDITWSNDKIDEVAAMPWDHDVFPTYVEVSFSNHCNFKCSYCSPVHSSRWVEEAKTHGPYPTSKHFNGYQWLKDTKQLPIPHDEENPYVDAFWKWWPELHKGLRVFRITGGEPLLEKHTFKVLDYLIEKPNPELEFSVNTNGCVPRRKIERFVEKMKEVEKGCRLTRIYTSVDGHGEQAEYGRHGLDYDEWLENIDYMMTEMPKTKFTIMCTTNIFSITSFEKLLEDIYMLKVKHHSPERLVAITLDTCILRWPGHQRANILPPEYASYMADALKYMKDHEEGNKANNIPHYKGFFDFEIAKLERFIEFMSNPINSGERINLTYARSDFYKFVNEHDRRRGTNFLATFPELTDFYNICKSNSDNLIGVRNA